MTSTSLVIVERSGLEQQQAVGGCWKATGMQQQARFVGCVVCSWRLTRVREAGGILSWLCTTSWCKLSVNPELMCFLNSCFYEESAVELSGAWELL